MSFSSKCQYIVLLYYKYIIFGKKTGIEKPQQPVKTGCWGDYILCLLHQQFRDLDSVGGGTFSDLIAAAPQA